jgi:DNA-binding response OmpR family regulator
MKQHTPSILVVDDDRDACHNLADILGDLGYQVDIAQDGYAALDLIRHKPYDVALLDYRMPGMDGLTLYREIKRLRAGTVAIVVTAYAAGATPEQALDAGAWRVLPKPVNVAELLALVQQAVDQPMVLVVDDDHDLCANLWDLLRQQDYRVALAHDVNDAQEQIKDTTFQVVLIDMRLPSGNGTTVFRAVRQVNPRARTVIITGQRSQVDEQVRQLLAEGADAVCYKPFDVASLLQTVNQLVRERQEETLEQSRG